MAYLNANSYDVEPMRVEATDYGPRFWLNGKPECGMFTFDELRAANPDESEFQSALWGGRITINATRTCKKCGK